jgi:WD40 repeat protein
VPVRTALLLIVVLTQTAHAQDRGPAPREVRFDKNGYVLPPGAVARFGVPPALSGFPWAVAWSADGKRFVVGDSDGLTEFDAATGRVLETQSLGAEFRSLNAVMTRDGRRLVFLNRSAARVHDLAGMAVRAVELPAAFADPERRVYSLSLSADSRFLAGVAALPARPGVAWRYDLARDTFTRLLSDRADLRSVCLSPDGTTVYAIGGSREPELTARDLRTGRELWTAGLKSPGAVRAMSGDGRRVAIADSNGLTVFDALRGKAVVEIPVNAATPSGMWSIDLSADGTRVALADCRKVAVWDVATGKPQHEWRDSGRLVAFSADGKALLTVGAWVQRWNVETGEPAYPVPDIDRPVGAFVLKWSADGRRMLTVWSGDRSADDRDARPDILAIWDVKSVAVSWRRASRVGVLTATLDRAGSVVLACMDDRQLRSWSVQEPARETAVAVGNRNESIPRSYTFLADGRLAVHTHDALVDLYAPTGWLADGRARSTPVGPFSPTYFSPAIQGTVRFGPNGSRIDLVTARALPPLAIRSPVRRALGIPIATSDTFVAGLVHAEAGPLGHVWESATGRIIVDLPASLPDWAGAVLSPDGRMVASADNDRLVLADLVGRGHVQTLPVRGARALAFSPDGRHLASSLADGTVLIWDVPRAQEPWRAGDSDRLWADLSANDAAPAWKAIWRLLDNPDGAIELLAGRLRPITAWNDTAALIGRLDHSRYAVREEAVRELAGRGALIEEDLRNALRSSPSVEQRERLQVLLRKLDTAVPPTGETLRGLRCIWLLERISTPAAKQVLAEIATGATGSRVTIEAKEALGRWPK